MLFQLVVAYVVTLVLYQVGSLAIKYTSATIVTVSCLVLAFALYFSVRYLVKHKGCNYECDHCPNNEHCTKR